MIKNLSNLLFMTTLISGSLLTISSNSWLSAWMGLEINLLSFIPLMNKTNNIMASESSLKYFLVQALASIILLFSALFLMFNYNLNFFNKSYFINILIMSALCLKLGAAPFHFWFPNVMEGLSWMNNLILMIWQKLAPLILISYCLMLNFMFYIIILSAMIGALGGLNQTSLRKLMAFSSINHVAWMFAAMYSNENLWFNYYLFYALLSSSVVMLFYTYKIFHINQIFSMFLNNSMMMFFLFLSLLSMGGLPPFLGFLPKLLVIQNMIYLNQFLMLFIMLMLTLITLYFYLRIALNAYLLNYPKISWNFLFSDNYWLKNMSLMLNFLSISGLFLITMIYLIL
uniref:NADH-ubiquinone oxidoreductase chain 2 n=1 Tax=Corethrella condita TaxID=2527952 RepID=A0A411NHH2_9DIPT|nr:NADH dehydrogenase subunit 2 [Corethrella condita]